MLLLLQLTFDFVGIYLGLDVELEFGLHSHIEGVYDMPPLHDFLRFYF